MELAEADKSVLEANQELKRRLTSLSLHSRNLIRSDFYQIKDAESVYAVGYFEKERRVKGGNFDHFSSLLSLSPIFILRFHYHGQQLCFWIVTIISFLQELHGRVRCT